MNEAPAVLKKKKKWGGRREGARVTCGAPIAGVSERRGRDWAVLEHYRKTIDPYGPNSSTEPKNIISLSLLSSTRPKRLQAVRGFRN
jgi:hypothetical protein